MSDDVKNVKLSTILEMEVDDGDSPCGRTVQFRIEDKMGRDAEVSFDGKNWYPAFGVYQAIRVFEDRYPLAFGEGLDADADGPKP